MIQQGRQVHEEMFSTRKVLGRQRAFVCHFDQRGLYKVLLRFSQFCRYFHATAWQAKLVPVDIEPDGSEEGPKLCPQPKCCVSLPACRVSLLSRYFRFVTGPVSGLVGWISKVDWISSWTRWALKQMKAAWYRLLRFGFSHKRLMLAKALEGQVW